MTQKHFLRALIVDNNFRLAEQVNPVWITDRTSFELFRLAVNCKMFGSLTPETLKTYIHEKKPDHAQKLLGLLREVSETEYIYSFDDIANDLEKEYHDGLIRAIKIHAMSKDATSESISALVKESVLLMAKNVREQYCHQLEDSIDEFRMKVASGEKDTFSESILKPEGVYKKIFAGAVYPYVYVIMTRPAGGKTAFSLNLMAHLNSLGKKSLFFALSDDTVQTLRAKYLGACSGVNIGRILNYELDSAEKDVIGKYCAPGQPRRIKVIDKPGLSGDKILSMIENLFIDDQYHAIFIDYVQRIGYEPRQTRKETIDRFMHGLTTISKKYNVAIFVLSQVSRAAEEKGGAVKLQLNSAKETGNIDEDARACLAIEFVDAKDSLRTLRWVKTTNFPYFSVDVMFDWKSGKLIGEGYDN